MGVLFDLVMVVRRQESVSELSSWASPFTSKFLGTCLSQQIESMYVMLSGIL